MKVLQISNFYPPHMGGIETVAWELTEGLNRQGVATDVLCAHDRARTEHEQASSGYRVTRASSWGLFMSAAVAPALLLHAWRARRGYDIWHVHMPNPIAALAVSVARPRSRIVVHWHSDVVRQRRVLWLYEPLQRWLLARADAIVATSPAYLEASQPLQPWLCKARVVPIGISPRKLTPGALTPQDIRRRVQGRRIVFALGRMIYYKGFEVLVDAAHSLPDDCVVLIGGDGPLHAQHQARVNAAGLQHKVRLLGTIPEADLAAYYEACDVFCLPSVARSEAYGVCVLEAMAVGKPVVTSSIEGSGVSWVNEHGKTGLQFPVGDSAALASAIRRLLADDQLRVRMGRAAADRYRQELTAQQMVRRFMDVYCGG